jgi:hypothetical protein
MKQKSDNTCRRCGSCGGQADPICGKDCCGSCGSCGHKTREITLTERERDFLLLLGQLPFLPLARFGELSPVYLESADEDIDTVLKTGLILRALDAKRLISLDYDKPLINGDYSVFERSEAYRTLCNEADHFTPKYGSIALTSLGQEALDSLSILGA